MTMNRVVLVGRLTKQVELKYTPNGVPVASFTLAVNRTYTNQTGERETDFINCIVWRRQAENAANFLKKGSLAGVDGKIQTRHYEGSDGKRVYVTEVVAESVQFLDSKKDSEGQPQGQQRNNEYAGAGTRNNENREQSNQNNNQGSSYNRNPYGDPFANDGDIDISDDDLPF